MHALPIWDDKNDKVICSTPLITMPKRSIHDVLDTIDMSMKINALKKALNEYSSGNKMKKLYHELKKDLELITQSDFNSSISINEYEPDNFQATSDSVKNNNTTQEELPF